MVRSLLVVPTGAGVGLARTCLGLVRALDRQGVNVAFVKPVAQPRADGSPDRSAALVAAITSLRPPDRCPPPSWSSSSRSAGCTPHWRRSSPPWSRSMTVPTSSWSRRSRPARPGCTPSSINQALAQALDADVLLVASWPATGRRERRRTGAGRTSEPGPDPIAGTVGDLAETLAIAASGYWSGEHARVVGCVVNGAAGGSGCGGPAGRDAGTARAAPHRCGTASPRADLAAGARPRPRTGPAGPQRGRPVPAYQGCSGVCPGRPGRPPRAHRGPAGGRPRRPPRRDHGRLPRRAQRNPLAALLLSAGIEPDPRVWELTRAAFATGLPILVVDDDSYETATRVA